MSTTPEPLDPDQVACPKATCLADPGVPCRRPNGKRAENIHPERRRLAAAGGIHEHDRAATEQTSGSKRAGQSPPKADRESRSKGGKAAAQARRRRRAEIEARAEELRVEAEAKAAEDEAQKVAEDAIRYTRDRALVKRQTLDAALKSGKVLLEALDDRRRIVLDDEGRITRTPVEVFDEYGERLRHPESGEPIVRQDPDVRGYVSTADLDRLAKVAASTLNSLRLEEGKATGITADATPGAAAALGEAGVEKLLTWAQQNPEALGGRAE